MKNLIVKILVGILLVAMLFVLSACTLQIETTDNSVSASVDGETTERVDSVIDWVKDRLKRFISVEGTSSSSTSSEPIGEGDSTIM